MTAPLDEQYAAIPASPTRPEVDAVVDDRPAAALEHERDHCAAHQEHRADVDRVGAIPLLDADRGDAAHAEPSRIVVQNVDSTGLRDRLGDDRADGLAVAHVSMDGMSV